jgi:hypothetical protein
MALVFRALEYKDASGHKLARQFRSRNEGRDLLIEDPNQEYGTGGLLLDAQYLARNLHVRAAFVVAPGAHDEVLRAGALVGIPENGRRALFPLVALFDEFQNLFCALGRRELLLFQNFFRCLCRNDYLQLRFLSAFGHGEE